MTLLSWLRREGRAGQFLFDYEQKRYTWTDRVETTIIVPADAEQLGDVSFYQDGMIWSRYPHRSAILRLGQNVWKDTSFERFYTQARALGKALGGYFFFDDRATPEAQANVIIQAMQGKQFELELFIDVERSYGGAYGGPARVRRLVELVEAAGVKCKAVGIYTGFYYWQSFSAGMSSADAAFFAARPLWLAWYAAESNVRVPSPWADYILWQWGTPVVDWGQPTAEIDANKSRYSRNDFAVKYLGGTTLPPNGGTMRYIEGTAKGSVTIRQTAAGEPYIPPRYLLNGDKIKASEVVDGRWLKLTEINGKPATGWSSAGTTQQYITWQWVEVTEPPPPDPEPEPPTSDIAGVRFTGEVIFDYTDGRQEVWHVTDVPFVKGPA